MAIIAISADDFAKVHELVCDWQREAAAGSHHPVSLASEGPPLADGRRTLHGVPLGSLALLLAAGIPVEQVD
jgi:hypothetical protein